MNVSFIVSIDSEAVDPNALMSTAEDIHSALDDHFDVIDVKPWARPTEGLEPTKQPQQQIGLPPVSGTT